MSEVDFPGGWYLLWAVVAICGTGTWYLRNFTQRIQLTRLVAIIGTVAMLSLVYWTWEIIP